jgi:hypothetical protein
MERHICVHIRRILGQPYRWKRARLVALPCAMVALLSLATQAVPASARTQPPAEFNSRRAMAVVCPQSAGAGSFYLHFSRLGKPVLGLEVNYQGCW